MLAVLQSATHSRCNDFLNDFLKARLVSCTAKVYLKTSLILHTLETSQSKGLSIKISAPAVWQYTIQ